MPTISKQFELTITPEQFLNACSVNELKELDLLIQSPRFQAKIHPEAKQVEIQSITFKSARNES